MNLIFCLLLVFSGLITASIVSLDRRINYETNLPRGTPTPFFATPFSETSCDPAIVMLTDDGVETCVYQVERDGTNYNGCRYGPVKSVVCRSGSCLAFDPSSVSFYGFTFPGNIDFTFSMRTTIVFYDYTDYDFEQRARYIYLVEGDTFSNIWVVLSTDFNAGSPEILVNLQNDKKIVGFAALSGRRFAISYELETTVYIYSSVDGSFIETLGTFGNVGPLAVDSSGQTRRLFVTDYTNDCIHIIDVYSDFAHSVINGISSITYFAPLLGSTLIMDSIDGIMMVINDPFTIESLTTKNVTCPSDGGSVTVQARGGAYYYTYNLLPDKADFEDVYTRIGYTEFTYNIPPFNPQVAPITLFEDNFHPVCSVFGTASIIDSVSVSGSSIYTKFYSRNSFGISCKGELFNPYQYKLEMMVNVGNGGQNFVVAQNCFGTPLASFLGNNLSLNNWTKITIDFTSALSDVFICDRSNMASSAANNIYFDNIRLVPHDGSRYITVTSCGSTLSSPSFVLYDDNALEIKNIKTHSTSCNNDGSNDILSSNAQVSVNISGGVSPYSYIWGFSNSTESQVTGLGAMDYNIIIYESKLHSLFYDASTATGKRIQDTSKFRSAPSSISFITITENEGLTLNIVDIDSPLSGDEFYALEFYVNGGNYGAQFLSITLKYRASNVGELYSLSKLANLVALPPNEWVLVRYPIPRGLAFTGLNIYSSEASISSSGQPRVYVDDMLSYNSRVLVEDSDRCSISSSYVTITQPAAIVVPTVVSHVQCFGDSDGTISLRPQGGTSPYSYSWSIAGQTGNSVSNLRESQVSVNVTDSLGCIPTVQTISVDVLQPPKLEYIFSMQPAKCYGEQGTLTASATGGVGPYTYIWSSDSTSSFNVVPQPQPYELFTDSFDYSASLSSLTNATLDCSGTGSHLGEQQLSHSGYCSLKAEPAVGDAMGITCIDCFDSSKYSELQFWINFARPSDASLFTIHFLKENASVSNPVPLTNFLSGGSVWRQVRADLQLLTSIADTFVISSTQATLSFMVDDIVLMLYSSNLLVRGITVNVGFQSIIRGVAASYTLSLTDGNLCSSLFEVNITHPERLTVVSDKGRPSATANNGTVSIAVTGGIPPYSYYWYGATNQTNATLFGDLGAGEYAVLVTDSNGCFVNHTISLEALPPPAEKSSSNTGMIAGIAAGVGTLAVAVAAVGGVYMKRQRKHVLLALQEAEEGERRNYKIDFAHLEIGPAIGAGSFGEVFSGVYKGADVAIKKLKSQQMTKSQVEEFAKEAAVMVGLRHPNILLFMGVCVEPANLCIVTEMMPRGNLMEVLKDQDIRLPNQIIFKMALDTLKGLQFIHSSGFIHRDLKSPNLLVDKYWNIKIADFGLSVARHSADDTAQVSLLWTAPEILRRDQNCYSFASDMYSFGIILWELATKQVPWEGMYPPAITAKVVAGERPPVDSLSLSLSQPVRDLITASWDQDPSVRPSVKKARAIVEEDIIPMMGTLEIGSLYDNSFATKETHSGTLKAPPPQPPLALVCCSVAHASELWDSDPRGMAKGLEGMISLLRRLSLMLSGYEITQDSPYIYAFANPINAINFCLRAQTELRRFDWPRSLLDCYYADETSQGSTILQRGLRVRMGVHWCDPVLRKDSFTMRPTYVGEAMNEGTALLNHAMGGAIVIDQEMYNRIFPSSGVDSFSINPLGVVTIGGITIPIFKVVPTKLKDLLEVNELRASDGGSSSSDSWMVNFDDIKLSSVIGSGAFGDVYSALLGDKKVAVKKFVKHAVSSALMLEMRTECAVLRGLNHENVIKFEGMCLKPPNLCLITELMERGALSGVLYSSVDLPWSRRLSFVKDIVRGMVYLHANEIVHRDIKSPNLLVDANWTIKIADFGFSRIKSANQTMTQCGTVSWTAPEIFAGSQYTEKADVFSFAVVLWELIFRKKPWEGRHSMKIIQVVESGGRLPISPMPNDVPEIIKRLLVQCWEHDPTMRPSFEDIEDQLSQV